jgi:hypothetical protein
MVVMFCCTCNKYDIFNCNGTQIDRRYNIHTHIHVYEMWLKYKLNFVWKNVGNDGVC